MEEDEHEHPPSNPAHLREAPRSEASQSGVGEEDEEAAPQEDEEMEDEDIAPLEDKDNEGDEEVAPPDIKLKAPPAIDEEAETSEKGNGLGTEDRMEVLE